MRLNQSPPTVTVKVRQPAHALKARAEQEAMTAAAARRRRALIIEALVSPDPSRTRAITEQLASAPHQGEEGNVF